MIGNLVQAQFGASRNWPFGAALGIVLVLALLLVMAMAALANQHKKRVSR
jgi:spermidine/putrescine transport system permease protein